MKFRYEAFNADGSVASGEIEADSRADADRAIREQGKFPSVVTPANASTGNKGKRSLQLGQNRLRQLTAFTRQLTVLLSSGTPLVDAIAAAARQTPVGPWRDVIEDVRVHVERGETLSSAMARHPNRFDPVYRSLIQAGESGGDMQTILERLSAMSRQQQVVQGTIVGAMVYPSLLMLVSGSVLVGLFIKVLPRFEELFDTLNAPLPPTTAVLLDSSKFIQSNALWLGLGVAAAVGGTITYARSAGGREFLQRALVRIPVLGACVRSFIVARFARVMGVMLEAQVPLLESLAVARSSVRHVEYAGIIEHASGRVERGEALSDSIDDGFLMPASITEAIRNGEHTGRVGEVLVTMADMLDEDNAIIARSATSILEPAILAMLGVVVGAVALSLFLPLFDLTASTGGA